MLGKSMTASNSNSKIGDEDQKNFQSFKHQNMLVNQQNSASF